MAYETCGSYAFTNTAWLETDDTYARKTASVTIPVTVPCEEPGCTLTSGYWKTHSKYGPAAYDETWAKVGEDTPFFLSPHTWYSQFQQSSSSGNAYFTLSRAYAAAFLNDFNAAMPPAVTAAMADALALLGKYTPQEIGALKDGDPLRQQFLGLYSILDQYNNGLIGPGHCG